MIRQKTIKQRRGKRVARIRAVVVGTSKRPRVSVFRSNKAVLLQVIDDTAGYTLFSVRIQGKNIAAGKKAGKELARVAKEKNMTCMVFDRGGSLYHGVIKEIADTMRKEGITL